VTTSELSRIESPLQAFFSPTSQDPISKPICRRDEIPLRPVPQHLSELIRTFTRSSKTRCNNLPHRLDIERGHVDVAPDAILHKNADHRTHMLGNPSKVGGRISDTDNDISVIARDGLKILTNPPGHLLRAGPSEVDHPNGRETRCGCGQDHLAEKTREPRARTSLNKNPRSLFCSNLVDYGVNGRVSSSNRSGAESGEPVRCVDRDMTDARQPIPQRHDVWESLGGDRVREFLEDCRPGWVSLELGEDLVEKDT
jgi:hypothetical protein